MFQKLKKLPAWLLILMSLVAVALLIGGLIGLFMGIATWEGFASILLLLIAIPAFGLFPLRKPFQNNIWRAVTLGFFALMGATIDQTGNTLYNQPVEWCCCPDESTLHRGVDISNPVPGSTYIEQDFTCLDATGQPIQQINMFAVLGIRFLEYMLLGYLILGLRWWFYRRRERKQKWQQ